MYNINKKSQKKMSYKNKVNYRCRLKAHLVKKCHENCTIHDPVKTYQSKLLVCISACKHKNTKGPKAASYNSDAIMKLNLIQNLLNMHAYLSGVKIIGNDHMYSKHLV